MTNDAMRPRVVAVWGQFAGAALGVVLVLLGFYGLIFDWWVAGAAVLWVGVATLVVVSICAVLFNRPAEPKGYAPPEPLDPLGVEFS